MSIQRTLCFTCCMVLVFSLHAQSPVFNQGFGLSGSHAFIRGNATTVDGSSVNQSSFSLRLRQYGLTYLARVDVLQANAFSVSIGSSVTAGWSVTRKYSSTDIINGSAYAVGDSIKGTHFAFDIPVFADLNVGLLSAADESKRRLGVYAGVGYSYSYTKIRLSAGSRRYDGFDPVFRAGIRMGRAWQNRWSINFSMRYNTKAGSLHPYVLRILKEL